MQRTEQIMGMPITITTAEPFPPEELTDVFEYFRQIDKKYSPYKPTSQVSQINDGQLSEEKYSKEMATILAIAEDTKRETEGYFDIWHNGRFDPSGVVKGWAIEQAAGRLARLTDNFYIEAGGDIQTAGYSASGEPWRIGIRIPFVRHENISIVNLSGAAVATSGTAIRGEHIYNPHGYEPQIELISLSVIAASICDADRFATAAFAMGKKGIEFIERREGYEAYGVTPHKTVLMTSGWSVYEAAYE